MQAWEEHACKFIDKQYTQVWWRVEKLSQTFDSQNFIYLYSYVSIAPLLNNKQALIDANKQLCI